MGLIQSSTSVIIFNNQHAIYKASATVLRRGNELHQGLLEIGAEMTVEIVHKPVVYSKYLERELRSDHAGETGAVYIYKGIIAVATFRKEQELIDFARHHGATEARHLELIESVLEKKYRSYLLVPWRIAGWLTGAIPALFGKNTVYATIDAVETFVERHYQQQIDYLAKQGGHQQLLALLIRCQADEIAHKNEARLKALAPKSTVLRLWCALVGSGSAKAVLLARQI